MLRQRHKILSILVFVATAPILTGCCSTCPSLSGRHSDMHMQTESVVLNGDLHVSHPKHIHGSLKEKMEARGVKSGCGEFFWSSWYNDGPEATVYHPKQPCTEHGVEVSEQVETGMSRASQRIIKTRRDVRVVQADPEI